MAEILENVCPFLSYFNSNTSTYESVECITSSCKIWDSVSSRCGMKTSDIHFHSHNSHDHILAHSCIGSYNANTGEFYKSCGSNTLPQLITRASILIQEFLFNEDLDGNEKVYGYDFKIIDSDTNKPPVLTQLESNSEWNDPDCCQITWEEFNDWLDYPEDEEKDPYREGGPCDGCE